MVAKLAFDIQVDCGRDVEINRHSTSKRSFVEYRLSSNTLRPSCFNCSLVLLERRERDGQMVFCQKAIGTKCVRTCLRDFCAGESGYGSNKSRIIAIFYRLRCILWLCDPDSIHVVRKCHGSSSSIQAHSDEPSIDSRYGRVLETGCAFGEYAVVSSLTCIDTQLSASVCAPLVQDSSGRTTDS